MSLKKIKIIDIFGIFALSVLFHFLYKWLPNPLFAIFFPVNESIWEHMKLFFSATLVWSIVDYYLIKKNNIFYENYSFQMFFTAFIAIPVYLLLFIPLRSIFGESMVLSIGLMFLVYIFIEWISYKLLTYKNLGLNKLSIPLIIIVYIIFIYLTYNPIHNCLFYDKTENKYGINEYDNKVN